MLRFSHLFRIASKDDPKHLCITILAITQVAGWGVVGFLLVLASSIADDLRTPLPTVFLGTTILYATMGLTAPIIGTAFKRLGARIVMVAGAMLIGMGLALLSVSSATFSFLSLWAVIGVGGAMLDMLWSAAWKALCPYVSKNDAFRSMVRRASGQGSMVIALRR